jgi:hypothetical protein
MSDKAHATWTASATARNWACPGALTLAAQVTEPERESEAAAWGTACHSLAERCLRETIAAASLIGTIVKTKSHTIIVDEELAATAQVYLDYIRHQLITYRKESGEDAIIFIEQRFSLKSLSPPFDAGGTGDAVIWYTKQRLIEIVDLKGGRGVVVEAVGNPQMRTYALGALLMLPGLDVDRVMTTIVQPRAPHRQGRIRSETFHAADLIEWTADLMAAMRIAAEAKRLADQYDFALPATWYREFLHPGDHCRFCPAAGFCPALKQRALDAAQVWYTELDEPRISNAPSEMDPAQLAKTLGTLDLLQEWMNAVRAYAQAQAESGVDIPGYQLVEKIGNRAWIGDEAVTRKALLALGLKPFDLDVTKLKSPAQIEKVLGAHRKDAIASLVERPVRGTNLVASDRTSRTAIKAKAEQFFEAI